jgi:hypothetical protein
VRSYATMTSRFQEPVEGVAWDWPLLVRCPRCGGRASVDGEGSTVRLTCGSCGLARDWDGRTRFSGGTRTGHDSYFGAELWLRSVCCGGRVLWARNAEHLEYLRAYVAGTLRESAAGENTDHRPKPLSAKLPAWLKAAKHREEVLRHLERMARTLS